MTPIRTPSRTTSSVIAAPDGRRIAVDVTGPANGPVVLLHSSAPGSRRFDPDPAATAAAGVRLVTLDRPGYGGSDPDPQGRVRSVADAADDAALVLDALGVPTATVAGWSAGGRVAMALAARRPDLVSSVAVIGTPAPHEEVPWIPDEFVALNEALAKDPSTAVATLEQLLAAMSSDPAAGIGQLAGPGDEQVLGQPGVRERLIDMLGEAFRQAAAGVAADIASYSLLPWGFDAGSVAVPVRAWYGEKDHVVGADHGRWWVDQVARGDLVIVPDIGHLVAVAAWADVLLWAAGHRA